MITPNKAPRLSLKMTRPIDEIVKIWADLEEQLDRRPILRRDFLGALCEYLCRLAEDHCKTLPQTAEEQAHFLSLRGCTPEGKIKDYFDRAISEEGLSRRKLLTDDEREALQYVTSIELTLGRPLTAQEREEVLAAHKKTKKTAKELLQERAAELSADSERRERQREARLSEFKKESGE